MASYAHSKNMAVRNGLSDPRYPQNDKGVTENDLPNNLVLSPIWELPFGNGRRFLHHGGILNQIVGGWQLTSILTRRSGFPFTPTLSGTDLLLLNGFHVADRPDRNCTGQLSDPTVFNWFDKSCFTTPVEPTTPGAKLHEGNSGYNILRGPRGFSLDSGISKSSRWPSGSSSISAARSSICSITPTTGCPAPASRLREMRDRHRLRRWRQCSGFCSLRSSCAFSRS